MGPPAVAALLDAWEEGLLSPAIERTLGLLAAGCPALSRDQLADLSIGRYDGALLRLREQTFGSRLVARTDCPVCGEALELEFAVSDVLVDADDQLEPEVATTPTIVISHEGYELELRLPSNRDLIHLRDHPDGDARRTLFQRCLRGIRRLGSDTGEAAVGDSLPALGPGSVPESVLDSVLDVAAEQMATADPQAHTRLALACAACSHRWQEGFDIGGFFWVEVDAWARRVLDEIHSLASAYGWSEAEILSLSPVRRQYYLELAVGHE